MSVRKTKIVCTIGPATCSQEAMEHLAKSGMDVMRVNLSHESPETHEERIRLFNETNHRLNKRMGLLMDTQGPEIRTGNVVDGKIFLKEGDFVVVTGKPVEGTAREFSVSYKDLPRLAEKGQKIFIADGVIELRVKSSSKTEMECEVIAGGEMGNHKNVSAPGVAVELPPLTPSDEKGLKIGARNGMDFVAQSFVQKAEDVLFLLEFLQDIKSDAHVIAKVESESAVKDLDRIIGAADGVMVARGDLGVQVPLEDVPFIQKTIVHKCNQQGKPVIVATHMLETMIYNPRPTRAEASDVANAVYDGADAVMLSGETAVGKYAFKAVETMAKIVAKSESLLKHKPLDEVEAFAVAQTMAHEALHHHATSMPEAICRSTVQLAHDLAADAILVPTSRGFSARMISKRRPLNRLVALTNDERVARKLSVVWGLETLPFVKSINSDQMMEKAVEDTREHGFVKSGDTVVIVAGIPLGLSGSTNTINVRRVP